MTEDGDTAVEAVALRTMYDDIVAQNVPAGGDLYLGYDDGAWPDAAALAARFPGKPVVRMTVNPNDDEGDGLDIESSNARPADGPGWISRRRAAGCWWAFLYANSSTWPAVESAVAAARLTGVRYMVAQYDGDPTIPTDWQARGCVAKQYAGGPTAAYDTSSVLAVWPGIDPAPHPLPTPPPPVVKPIGDLSMAHEITLTINVEPDPSGSGSAGWATVGVFVDSIVSIEIGGEDPAGSGKYDHFDAPTAEAIAVGQTKIQLSTRDAFTGPVTVRVFVTA